MKVKVAQSCPTLCDPMDYTAHGILQARILEWVVFPFSRGTFQPRDWTQVSRIAGRFFTSWATREALKGMNLATKMINRNATRVEVLSFKEWFNCRFFFPFHTALPCLFISVWEEKMDYLFKKRKTGYKNEKYRLQSSGKVPWYQNLTTVFLDHQPCPSLSVLKKLKEKILWFPDHTSGNNFDQWVL